MSEEYVDHTRNYLDDLIAKCDRLEADNAELKRIAGDFRFGPEADTYQGPATGDLLVDRLRGIYTAEVPGGGTFTTRSRVGPIDMEAVDEIEKLKADKAELLGGVSMLLEALELVTNVVYKLGVTTDQVTVNEAEVIETLRAAFAANPE